MTDAGVPVVWVDAFCDGPFTGNPAAVCVLDRPAPAEAMQRLAAELGLSETAFVWGEEAGFALRWFTPLVEVDLCGHATVAAAHALARAGRLEDGTARFSTRSGPLVATVDGEEVEIDLPAETPEPVTVPAALSALWPAVRAARGRFDLVVELADEDAVRATTAGTPQVAAQPYRGVIVTAPGGRTAADYVLRFFAPQVGVEEDPVTGSAQCLLGPYWAAALGRDALSAAQLSARAGSLRVTVAGDRVRVAGRAVSVLSGELTAAAARWLLGTA